MFDWLWDLSPTRAWIIALTVTLSILSLISAIAQSVQEFPPLMVIVTGILIFVFLTQLPDAHGWGWIKHEFNYLCGSVVIALISFLWMFAFAQSRFVLSEVLMPGFVILAGFSHVTVRFYARLSMRWKQMRRRRLLWEITHAQLRLVMLTMAALCILFIISIITNNNYIEQTQDQYILNTLALFISISGFFGIITGILLLIVIVPAGIVSYRTAQRLTRRLEDLTVVTHAVRAGHSEIRVAVEGEDEISALQTNFNQMMNQLAATQQALTAERDTVRQLLQQRQRLFADISHELRTPIATIRSSLSSLTGIPDITLIEREILRLQHLVDDVFTFARTDLDQLRYDLKPLELSGVLEQIAQTMRQQVWQARKVEVILDYQPPIPLVMADQTRIEQVLFNLLRNAAQHTPPGGLIRIGAASAGDVVRLEVQDTGTGIAPKDLPHIWERFYRSDENRVKDTGGAGLGLALVKQMVEAMGGCVSVESELGRGSTFSLTFPRITQKSP